jgi:hypothetical protein
MAEEVKAVLTAIDLDNVNYQSDALGDDYNPNADAFARLTPVDDGLHRVRLLYGEMKQTQGEPVKGFVEVRSEKGTYLVCKLELKPVNEKEKWTAFDGYVSTMVMPSVGTSRVAGIIRELTGAPAKGRTHAELARELHGLIKGGAICRIETRWNAQCSHGRTGKDVEWLTVKSGQSKFPESDAVDKDGKRIKDARSPAADCPDCGAEVFAQAKIVRYLPDGSETEAPRRSRHAGAVGTSPAPTTQTATDVKSPFAG